MIDWFIDENDDDWLIDYDDDDWLIDLLMMMMTIDWLIDDDDWLLVWSIDEDDNDDYDDAGDNNNNSPYPYALFPWQVWCWNTVHAWCQQSADGLKTK